MRLQNEHNTSIELARNVQNLTNNVETTTIALMAMQQKVNVAGQCCSVCLYLVVAIEFHLIKICFLEPFIKERTMTSDITFLI